MSSPTRLDISTDGYYYAADVLHDDTLTPAVGALLRTVSTLRATGQMAGSDPGGQSWAASYDRAAWAAITAAQNVLNGTYRLVCLLERTALNYERAEAASTPGGGPAETIWPHDESYAFHLGSVPSASGGSSSPPSGWWLIEHTVGYVWPDGHQDRLHAAGAAWSAGADVLDEVSGAAPAAPVLLAAQSAPEVGDLITACNAMGIHYGDLAGAFRTLAAACHELAHRIDEVHSEVASELRSLLEWSAGIQVAGGLLSAVTFGIAEAPTQAAQAAKIAATAAKVSTLIEQFITVARAAVAAIPVVERISASITQALDELLGARLAMAGINAARALPDASAAARAARAAEMTADDRLAVGVIQSSKTVAKAERAAKAAEEVARERTAIAKTLELTDVPATARSEVIDTVRRAGTGIKSFTRHDGKTYENWDGLLPHGVEYKEWTVAGASAKRGTFRLIIGGSPKNPTSIYFWDHVNPPILIGP